MSLGLDPSPTLYTPTPAQNPDEDRIWILGLRARLTLQAREGLHETLRARLSGVLDADQLKALDALRDELVERIRHASFANG